MLSDKQKEVYVVGDVFCNVEDDILFFTSKKAIALIQERTLRDCTLHILQAVSTKDVSKIKSIAEQNNIVLQDEISILRKCPANLVHKRKDENVLISEIVNMGPKTYNCYLSIDGQCEEFSDHITGKHLPLMVIMEAARQMGTAVTELHHLENKNFITNKIEVALNRFLYPAKVELTCVIVERIVKFDDNSKMKIKIDFLQGNFLCASVFLEYMVLDKKFVSSIEKMQLVSMIQ